MSASWQAALLSKTACQFTRIGPGDWWPSFIQLLALRGWISSRTASHALSNCIISCPQSDQTSFLFVIKTIRDRSKIVTEETKRELQFLIELVARGSGVVRLKNEPSSLLLFSNSRTDNVSLCQITLSLFQLTSICLVNKKSQVNFEIFSKQKSKTPSS